MVYPGGASIEPALEASAAMYLSYARIRMQLISPPSPVKVKLPFRGSFLLVVSPPSFPVCCRRFARRPKGSLSEYWKDHLTSAGNLVQSWRLAH